MATNHHTSDTPLKRQAAESWFVPLCILIVVVGASLALLRINIHQQHAREVLKAEAEIVSWAIDAGEVQQLIAAGDNKTTSPLYQRLSDQVARTKALFPECRDLRIVYKSDDDTIATLIETEDTPLQPDDIGLSTLQKGVISIRNDRDSGVMQICVPILDLITSRTVAALVFDSTTTGRLSLFYREVVPVLLYTLIMLALATGLLMLIRRRSRRHGQGWKPGVVFVLLSGLLTTGIVMQTVHRFEHRVRTQAFLRIAGEQADQLQQAFRQVGRISLEGIARFFDSSNFVDEQEFSTYIGHLSKHPYTPAWLWMPQVEPSGLKDFEQAVCGANRPDYRIFPGPYGDESAEHGSTIFPVCYVAPGMDDNILSGMDLAAIASTREAIEAARSRGLTTASGPVILSHDAALTNRKIVVFRPVFNRQETNLLSGLVASVLNPSALLDQILSRQISHNENFTKTHLVLIEEHIEHIDLCPDWTGEHSESHIHIGETHDEEVFIAPAFAFGKVFALETSPADGFIQAHPHRGLHTAAGAGLLTTVLLTLLAGLLANQRHLLEQTIRRRQGQLAKSEESYRGLFNSIRHALCIIDCDRHIVDINVSGAELYGYTKDEIIGSRAEVLGHSEPGSDFDFDQAFREAWGGQPYHAEFLGLKKTGQTFSGEIWMYKSNYFGEDVVIAVSNDISKRKGAEQEQELLRAQLLQAQKMESVGRLAGGIAHDFNNMLQAILGNVALAREEVEENRSPIEQLIEVENSAKRSVSLTRQLLAFASRQTIQPRPLSINRVIGSMTNMLRILVGESITLEWKPDPKLKATLADQNQIEQVLTNLVVNARDAVSGSGVITISTRNFACDRKTCGHICTNCHPGEYVRISVTDNGCGMDEGTVRNIFEPFYTTKQPGKGTGLGLATVFGIINQNNGVISVKSTPGKGTSMHVMLPCVEGEEELPEQSIDPDPLREGSETVLFVEDEASVLKLGVAALQGLGYRVLPAASPREAIALAREHSGEVNLIISDVILPEMNGAELVESIREIIPDIPVIFISGYTADIISDQGIVDQSVNFVQKPFTIPELATKIRDLLDNRAS